MPSAPLRWGLLSTARINRALIAPLRNSPRNKLVAVASRDSKKVAQYAKEWEIGRTFDSYEAMLADPDIDVIYNSLPNSMHAEWTIKAAQAGKHVLCEKPLACTLEDVDAMTEAAKKAGVVVMEGFMYRHHAQTLKVKELIDKGTLGKLVVLTGSFSFPLSNLQDVRMLPELGGGSIWDIGCYPISYARTMVGQEPLEVFGWQETGPTGVDLTFAGQMRFADNVFAVVDFSFCAPERMRMEIVGTTTAITISNPFKPGRVEELPLIRTNDLDPQTVTVTGDELYLGEVENMADIILDGKPQRVTLQDSRNNVAVILALLESARTGQPVKMGA